MAGQSQWSKVQRPKGPLDQKRGKLFSKLAKEITAAARMTSEAAPLRGAVLTALAMSMPSDHIERAIKQGTGLDDNSAMLAEFVRPERVPSSESIWMKAATDKKNRVARELRLIFSQNHANLLTSESVTCLFPKQQVVVRKAVAADEKILEIALEAEAEKLTFDGSHHILTTAPDQLYVVAEALKYFGVCAGSQRPTFIPGNSVSVTDEALTSLVLKLIDSLEDHEDVQNVVRHFDAPAVVRAKVSG